MIRRTATVPDRGQAVGGRHFDIARVRGKSRTGQNRGVLDRIFCIRLCRLKRAQELKILISLIDHTQRDEQKRVVKIIAIGRRQFAEEFVTTARFANGLH